MPCIYKILNTQTGDFYIGSTSYSIKKRGASHLSQLRGDYHRNDHLQRAYNKYGESTFQFVEIEAFKFPETYSKSYLHEYLVSRELFWIELLNPTYNKCREFKAGKLGNKRSEEATRKANETRNKTISERGFLHSEEARVKIREARAKQVITEEHKRKIGEKARGNKYCLGKTIPNEIKQKIKKSKEQRAIERGYYFNTEAIIRMKDSQRRLRSKPVNVFDINNMLIHEFNSLPEASEYFKVKKGSLWGAIKNNRPFIGYTFKYKEVIIG